MRSSLIALLAFIPTFAFAAPPSIRVGDFSSISDQPTTRWIGPALHDSLEADLVRAAAAHLSNAPTDEPGFLISGSYQVVDTQVRVTGRVIDSAGHVVGAMKVRGDTHDFFALEDELSNQVRTILIQAANLSSPGDAQRAVIHGGPSAESFAVAPSGPIKFNAHVLAAERKASFDPDPNRRAATWRYYYSYPSFDDCGYGYGCGYGSFGFAHFGGFGFFGRGFGTNLDFRGVSTQ